MFALTYPSMNALASRQTPADAQGELQGAIACLYSLSAILGPPLMTQVFGYFSGPRRAVHFPGAPFLTAAAAHHRRARCSCGHCACAAAGGRTCRPVAARPEHARRLRAY